MGFGFRKSVRLGPFRLNLSKSGVGGSVGVKGFRVGVSAKGQGYVSAGAGGLHYRGSLPAPQSHGHQPGFQPHGVTQAPRRWFLSRNGETSGPFDYSTIERWSREGEILPGTWAGEEGGDRWVAVEQMLLSLPPPTRARLTVPMLIGIVVYLAVLVLLVRACS